MECFYYSIQLLIRAGILLLKVKGAAVGRMNLLVRGVAVMFDLWGNQAQENDNDAQCGIPFNRYFKTYVQNMKKALITYANWLLSGQYPKLTSDYKTNFDCEGYHSWIWSFMKLSSAIVLTSDVHTMAWKNKTTLKYVYETPSKSSSVSDRVIEVLSILRPLLFYAQTCIVSDSSLVEK